MMNPPLKTDINVKLPLSFIIFGLLAFTASQIILLIGSEELLSGLFRIPKIWMSAHFLLLGFSVMSAMGAMYQLIPVVFLTKIWNEKFGFFQFFITAAGITLFALLLGFRTNFAIYGGALTVFGILLFILQMAKTLLAMQTKNSSLSKFVIGALVALILTITAGFLLAWNLAFGEVINHVPILLSHITLGVAGWFPLLIFGMSYKLVPMFSLSHGFKNAWEKAVFYTYGSGLIVTILSYWIVLPAIRAVGFLLLLLGFGFFILDMKDILTNRMKKKLDVPFTFSLVAAFNGFVIHIVGFLAVLLGFNSQEFWGWTIFLYVISFLLFSILGYLYKIVPFLWWAHKYSDKVGKDKVPTLKEMINEKLIFGLYLCFYISLLGIILSIALQAGQVLFLSLALQAATSILFAGSIIKIMVR